ncbi:TPA: DUF3021 family protein, partial [Streptococcus suis]
GLIPFIIMSAISMIMKIQKIDTFQIRSTFIVGIILSCVLAASVIYEIENWSLAKQSIIHFIVMSFTVFPCLLLSGWFEVNTFLDCFKVFAIFSSVGIVLWGVSYLIFGKLLSK